ncbi:MAG: hypothetical protein KBD62_37295, partial [Kofleriaceae bacterium]|nr:hypothetical protein [Kofleriaceae bacterium]
MNKLTDDIRRTVRGEQAGAFSVPRCMEWLAYYEQALATAERELAEARVDLTNCADVGRRLEIELRRAVAEAAEADTTRR